MRSFPDLLAKRAELSPDKVGLETYGGGPSRTYAELVCDGMDAWQSFYGSRENAFVSEVRG